MTMATIARAFRRVRALGYMTAALRTVHEAFYKDARDGLSSPITSQQRAALSSVLITVAHRCVVSEIAINDLYARVNERRKEYYAACVSTSLSGLLSELSVHMLGASELEKNTNLSTPLRMRISTHLERIVLTIDMIMEKFGGDYTTRDLINSAGDQVHCELVPLVT